MVAARDVAEKGARDALQSLAVALPRPHDGMQDEDKALRNRLRAHGRQLGDRRDPNTTAQEVDRLRHEVAYEHWHRMLFARFLAENGLLIEPESRVAVSLAECEELAREQGRNLWAMAGAFAQRMLPQIFRVDDPALAVVLPLEARQQLERLVAGLPREVFLAEDALGWTYQFWQKAEKDRVNARAKSGEKITGATLPAVTQLFTEHYMVQFLLHNTLGAWHAGKVLAARPELAQQAQSEAELRAAVALPGYSFDYLRFVREGDGPWRPAAGVFAGWPRDAKELKVLDPCCGSGHFLVAGFELLTALRQHEEGLPAGKASVAVLRENLSGLELDARCVQIAAFALAVAAWRRAGVVVELPPLQVACCGVGPSGPEKNWLATVDRLKLDEDRKNGLRRGMAKLYVLFQQAPELGSLIEPRMLREEGFAAPIDKLMPLLEQALRADAADEDEKEQAVVAQGMAKAAAILGQTFTLVVTNVPYLGRGTQGDVLKEFAEQHYPDAKADLATIFVQRIFGWLGQSGTMALVTPQNWLFLTSYKKLREKLLKERTWDMVARLGPRAFETIGGHVVNVALIEASASKAMADHAMGGVEVSSAATPHAKAALLRGETATAEGAEAAAIEADNGANATPTEDGEGAESSGPADGSVKLVTQADQLKNPDARVVFGDLATLPTVGRVAGGWQGISTSDLPRFGRCFWELGVVANGWRHKQGTVVKTVLYGAREQVLFWEDGYGAITEVCQEGATFRGKEAWGKPGVSVSQMGDLPVTLYSGDITDSNAAALVPRELGYLPALWAFCRSEQFPVAVRSIDQSLKVTNATLVKVPFDIEHWQRVAAEQYPLGLPEPQTNDPTQWLFHGHPAGMLAAGPASAPSFSIQDPVGWDRHPSLICRTPNAADVLQVATVRLLGYRWPAELDADMRLDDAQRAWVKECENFLPFVDTDGIVCLQPTRGEPSAAERLRALLRAAFGEQWSMDTERKLLAAAAGLDGKPAASLDEWLRDRFFEAHCKLFQDRPFVWHIWDGRKDGFHALVNYHRLAAPRGAGRNTLDALAYSYLGEWIERQRQDQKQGVEGADGRLAAALRLQGELKKILDGEPPYDLFVRWKPLHEQPLGWAPDINDGVRLNIRPFLSAVDVDKKGAGILRAKVGVKWSKDRGKEPEALRPRAQFPWFWGCDPEKHTDHQQDFGAATKTALPAGPTFDGVRWNDLHYTRAAKEAARKAKP